MEKHQWTDEECEVVCKVFKDELVDSYGSVDNAIEKIEGLCPDLQPGSIRMKISNTIYICDELGINYNCTLKSLDHYSVQHRRAFKKVFGL